MKNLLEQNYLQNLDANATRVGFQNYLNHSETSQHDLKSEIFQTHWKKYTRKKLDENCFLLLLEIEDEIIEFLSNSHFEDVKTINGIYYLYFRQGGKLFTFSNDINNPTQANDKCTLFYFPFILNNSQRAILSRYFIDFYEEAERIYLGTRSKLRFE